MAADSKSAPVAETEGEAEVAAPEKAAPKAEPKAAAKVVVPEPVEVEAEPVAVASAADPFAGLSRAELVRLRTAVEHALFNRGEDSALAPGQSLREQAQLVPPNDAATAAVDAASAAKAAGLKRDEVLDYKVRQAVAPDGSPDGPAFLVVVDPAGNKHVSRL
jgi:hypothetical protein